MRAASVHVVEAVLLRQVSGGEDAAAPAPVAREAGLTAGALVQRFGSKRGLIVAMAERAARATPAVAGRLRAAHRSPLEALRGYADRVAEMGEAPGGVAHHLAYLQLDLTDPDLRRAVREQARAGRALIRGLLAEAAAAGELAGEPPLDELARTVEATVGGSLLGWAIYQEGTVREWIRRDLEAVLRPYLPRGA